MVNHHKKSSRIFATRLMLFCAGNVVDDDVTVNRIFLVNPVCSLQSAVCSLQSANVIHRSGPEVGRCLPIALRKLVAVLAPNSSVRHSEAIRLVALSSH